MENILTDYSTYTVVIKGFEQYQATFGVFVYVCLVKTLSDAEKFADNKSRHFYDIEEMYITDSDNQKFNLDI